MVKQLLLAVALVALLAMPAAGSRCYITGNARRQVCRCGQTTVPMWVCRK